MENKSSRFEPGQAIVLRYVLTDGCIEMAWPCRVVQDSDLLVALFIAAGTKFKADPKKTAAEKRADPPPSRPSGEHVWKTDTLRLMLPEKMHSLWLFWEGEDDRRLSKLFVNMEEPFRRTSIGFDTQDHTIDIVVQPDLSWSWRDEEELANHVQEGFFTPDLAMAARAEGLKAVEDLVDAVHPCLPEWLDWRPDKDWEIPVIQENWASTPPTFWARRLWAYGVRD